MTDERARALIRRFLGAGRPLSPGERRELVAGGYAYTAPNLTGLSGTDFILTDLAQPIRGEILREQFRGWYRGGKP